MSFDAWVVAFGTSALLRELHLVESKAAYLVMAVIVPRSLRAMIMGR